MSSTVWETLLGLAALAGCVGAVLAAFGGLK